MMNHALLKDTPAVHRAAQDGGYWKRQRDVCYCVFDRPQDFSVVAEYSATVFALCFSTAPAIVPSRMLEYAVDSIVSHSSAMLQMISTIACAWPGVSALSRRPSARMLFPSALYSICKDSIDRCDNQQRDDLHA